VKLDLSGRVALVTGGSRGIGQAIATALHCAGAKVAVLAKNGAGAQAAARALGDSARGYACDVGDAAQVETVVASVARGATTCCSASATTTGTRCSKPT